MALLCSTVSSLWTPWWRPLSLTLRSVPLVGTLRTDTRTTGFYCPRASCQSRLSMCRLYSSSSVRRGLGRYVSSRLQRVNSRYEDFLRRRFPSLYKLHRTLREGSTLLFTDAKELHRIKMMMSTQGLELKDLTYRDLEKLRQFRRDLLKAAPMVVMCIPPFANYLVLVLMYFFPRQLLIPHYWTPKQQVEFHGVYHSLRARCHGPVLSGLETATRRVKDCQLQGRLQDLCAKVSSGVQPEVGDILAVRKLFSGPPLGIHRMKVNHMRQLSPLLFLTPHLPGFVIGRRLNSHALELLLLDRALSRLGLQELSDLEIRQACFIRGLPSYSLSISQCRDWLSTWLQVSSSLKDSEVSLLLHNIVFLSANYPNAASRR